VADNTDGTTPAAQGVTGTPPESTVTQPVVDNTGRDAEGRIAGLVAERARKDEKISALEKQIAETAEQHKSDEDKRIDQLVTERVESEYKPVQQRLERIEVELTAKRDKILESLPEDSRNCFDESAPVEVQVRQIELVTSHLSTHKSPAILDSGGNPAPEPPADKTRYSRAQYQEVQRLASFDPDEFDKVWPTMKKALEEGRIDGVNSGGVIIKGT